MEPASHTLGEILWDKLPVVFSVLSAAAGSIVTMVWAGGKWTGRITAQQDVMTERITEGFSQNHEDHRQILVRLEDHSERLAAVETQVSNHRDRYP